MSCIDEGESADEDGLCYMMIIGQSAYVQLTQLMPLD